MIRLTAVAESREFKINMPNVKVGAASSKSIIAKRHADASLAVKHPLSEPETIRDLGELAYETTYRITLRCVMDDSPQTFSEVFYVSEDLEYDAILRKNAGS